MVQCAGGRHTRTRPRNTHLEWHTGHNRIALGARGLLNAIMSRRVGLMLTRAILGTTAPLAGVAISVNIR